jgi:hypothetical protein
MSAQALYLGVIRNGEGLLTSFAFYKGDEKSEARAEREAEQSVRDWRAVYPGDRLSVERLAKRGAKGWEVAGR